MYRNIIADASKKGFSYNYAEFLCDTISDIESLPTSTKNVKGRYCSVGSKAAVLETKEIYILNNQNEWVYLSKIGSSGVAAIEMASVEETVEYLNIGGV